MAYVVLSKARFWGRRTKQKNNEDDDTIALIYWLFIKLLPLMAFTLKILSLNKTKLINTHEIWLLRPVSRCPTFPNLREMMARFFCFSGRKMWPIASLTDWIITTLLYPRLSFFRSIRGHAIQDDDGISWSLEKGNNANWPCILSMQERWISGGKAAISYNWLNITP